MGALQPRIHAGELVWHNRGWVHQPRWTARCCGDAVSRQPWWRWFLSASPRPTRGAELLALTQADADGYVPRVNSVLIFSLATRSSSQVSRSGARRKIAGQRLAYGAVRARRRRWLSDPRRLARQAAIS